MTKSLSLDDISSILQMLEERDVREFKLERDGEKLSLRRGPQAGEGAGAALVAPLVQSMSSAASQFLPPVQQLVSAASVEVASPKPSAEVNSNYAEVKSPMVGTFYRRPAADADPYVQVGDVIKKGQVLCIVEAMKIMNEIESDVSGRVVQVCLEDTQMVEYGEVLFRVDPGSV